MGYNVCIGIVLGKHCSDSSGALSDEVAIMKKIEPHQNVIALIGVCLLNGLVIVIWIHKWRCIGGFVVLGPLWVVMEYAEHGDLLNYLRSLRPPGTLDSHILKSCVTKDDDRVLKEESMWNFAVQIMSGMEHLISHQVKESDSY